ncbi:SDR family oxidoreductase [Micromonospora sp. RTGN7]|uniref:SDR family oxidoreductase n=1 Tax=Micromonospora sp. RTGN7 TaxID=3016526 RepID=UPI0029FED3F4|nr:SDR family oxidoreductase [Micromonospora sp. RTGN7]
MTSLLSLAGRTYLVTGVLNNESIAWHVAAALQREGCEVILTSFGRVARITRKVADLLPTRPEVLDLDVMSDQSVASLAADIESRWGRLDGVLHSIAAAPPDALGPGFVGAPAGGVLDGFRVSSYSFQQVTTALAPLLRGAPGGGAVVGLTVDSTRALPGYGWMGVYKSALEAISRYLALHLGPAGIRVNLVAAGPVETVSARGVGTFSELAEQYERWAPLGWDRTDPARVVGAVLFLLSDLSRQTTGQVVHADGGMHAVFGGVGVPPAATPSPGRTATV